MNMQKDPETKVDALSSSYLNVMLLKQELAEQEAALELVEMHDDYDVKEEIVIGPGEEEPIYKGSTEPPTISPGPSSPKQRKLQLEPSSSPTNTTNLSYWGSPSPATPQQPTMPVRSAPMVSLNYGSEDDSGDEDATSRSHIKRVDRVHLHFSGHAEDPPPPSNNTELLDFRWFSLPHPPIPVEKRRYLFLEINNGPTAAAPTPYDAFVAIWDQRIMEHIAQETNRYARRELNTLAGTEPQGVDWSDTTVDELYVFFALMLATGVCVKPDTTEYWAKNCSVISTPSFKNYMSLDRFQILVKYLHFTDNDVDVSGLSRADARLRKVAPVVEHLNERFQALYAPGRDVVVDAALAQWKGWSDIGRREGIKVYELYEAKTGYLWRFHLHSGETPVAESSLVSRVSVSGVVPRRVLSLLEGLQYKGHTVWMDRSFSSPALATALRTLGFDCVGILQTTDQLIPPALTASKPEMVVGKMYGVTSGDVDVLMWRGPGDLGLVAMVSTYHGGAFICNHDGGKPMPRVMRDYNACLRGLHKKDQILAKHPVERKQTRTWYKILFERLLNVSALNAFILHGYSSLPGRHRRFVKDLIKEVLAKHAKESTVLPATGKLVFTKEVSEHFPRAHALVEGQPSSWSQRQCARCGKDTRTYCPGCEVSLCAFTCHVPYHSISQLSE